MASCRVEIKEPAQKEIRKLPKGIREKVIDKIAKLAAEPIPPDTVNRTKRGGFRSLLRGGFYGETWAASAASVRL